MNNIYKIFVAAIFITTLSACEPKIEMVSLGINEEYAIERMRVLCLHPEFPGEAYAWSMKDCDGNDSIISRYDIVFSWNR